MMVTCSKGKLKLGGLVVKRMKTRLSHLGGLVVEKMMKTRLRWFDRSEKVVDYVCKDSKSDKW
jgi:hypothetical protein